MKTWLLGVVLTCASFQLCANGTGLLDEVTNLSGLTAEGARVQVVILNTTYSTSIPYREGFRWGAESSSPKSVITAIRVKVADNEVFVPLSAYSDLANPREAFLEKIKDGVRLVIRGGDAAASYEAFLVVRDGFLKSRKVAHREFPKASWEETNYSYNVR